MNYFDEVQFQAIYRRYKISGSVDMLHLLITSLECVCKGVVFAFGQTNSVVDKDDLVQIAVEAAMRSVDDFDPKKGTAFNFFTTVARRTISKKARVEIELEDRAVTGTDKNITLIIQDGTRFGLLLSEFLKEGNIYTRTLFAQWIRLKNESTKGLYVYLDRLRNEKNM